MARRFEVLCHIPAVRRDLIAKRAGVQFQRFDLLTETVHELLARALCPRRHVAALVSALPSRAARG
jgi:hypothetical protein